MMNRFMLMTCCLMLTLMIASKALSAEHTKDTVDQIKARLKDNKAILFDVREQREWDAGHLKQAKLVPLSKLRGGVDPKELLKELTKDKIIYCHCASGRRVLIVADILKDLGYDCRPLKQGYSELLKSGFPKVEN